MITEFINKVVNAGTDVVNRATDELTDHVSQGINQRTDLVNRVVDTVSTMENKLLPGDLVQLAKGLADTGPGFGEGGVESACEPTHNDGAEAGNVAPK